MLTYHMTAMLAGFLLDLAFGDPYWLPHPVRLIGAWIAFWEKKLNRREFSAAKRRRNGVLLVLFVTGGAVLVTGALLGAAYRIHPYLGVAAESVMTYQLLAVKCLRTESMKVYAALKAGDLAGARHAVSMIVGRDTERLDEGGVVRAAVETVAENTSDGVIAPMLYTALGGPVFGFFYKSVNTMDSMVGYKNEKYLDFGRAAAKLDDALNFIPARVSAFLLMVACVFCGKAYDAAGAYRIWKRDRYRHASPNAGQTEAACAGALGVRLAGNASYFGKMVEKPYIGDDTRPAEAADIRRANRLLYGAAFLGEGICLVLLGGISIICIR